MDPIGLSSSGVVWHPPPLPTFAHKRSPPCSPSSSPAGAHHVYNYFQPDSFNEIEDHGLLESISTADRASLLPIIRVAFPSLRHSQHSPFAAWQNAHPEVGKSIMRKEDNPSVCKDESTHIAMILQANNPSVEDNPSLTVDDSPQNALIMQLGNPSMLHNPPKSMDKPEQIAMIMQLDNPSMVSFVHKEDNPSVSVVDLPQNTLLIQPGNPSMEDDPSVSMHKPKQIAMIIQLGNQSMASIAHKEDNPSVSMDESKLGNPFMDSIVCEEDSPSVSIYESKQITIIMQKGNYFMASCLHEDKEDNPSATIDQFKQMAMPMQMSNPGVMQKEDNPSIDDPSLSMDEPKEGLTNMQIRNPSLALDKAKHTFSPTRPSTSADVFMGWMTQKNSPSLSTDAPEQVAVSMQMEKPVLTIGRKVMHKEGNPPVWMDECKQTDLGLEMGNPPLAMDECKQTDVGVEMGNPPYPPLAMDEHKQYHFIPTALSTATDPFALMDEPRQESEIAIMLQMGYPSDELDNENTREVLQYYFSPTAPAAEGLYSTGACSPQSHEELGLWHPTDFWARTLKTPSKRDNLRLLQKPETIASMLTDDKLLHSIALGSYDTTNSANSSMPSLTCVSSDTSASAEQAYESGEMVHEAHFDGPSRIDNGGPLLENRKAKSSIDGKTSLFTIPDNSIMTSFNCLSSEASRIPWMQDQAEAEHPAGESDEIVHVLHSDAPSSSNSRSVFLETRASKRSNDVDEPEILKAQACPGSMQVVTSEHGGDGCVAHSFAEVTCKRRKAIMKAVGWVRRKTAKYQGAEAGHKRKECAACWESRYKRQKVSGYAMHRVARIAQADSPLSGSLRHRRKQGWELGYERGIVSGYAMRRSARITEVNSPLSAALILMLLESGNHGVTVCEALKKLLKRGHSNLFTSSQSRAVQVKVALRRCPDFKELRDHRFVLRSSKRDNKEEHNIEDGQHKSPQMSMPHAAGSSSNLACTVDEQKLEQCHKTDGKHWGCPNDAITSLSCCEHHSRGQSKTRADQSPGRSSCTNIQSKKNQTPVEKEESPVAKNHGHEIENHRHKTRFYARACQNLVASGGALDQLTGDNAGRSAYSSKHEQHCKTDKSQCSGGECQRETRGKVQSPAKFPCADIQGHVLQKSADKVKESQKMADGCSEQSGEHSDEDKEPKLERCRRNDGKYWQCPSQSVAGSVYCEHHTKRRHTGRMKASGGAGHCAAVRYSKQELHVSQAWTLDAAAARHGKWTSSSVGRWKQDVAGPDKPDMERSHIGCKENENAQEVHASRYNHNLASRLKKRCKDTGIEKLTVGVEVKQEVRALGTGTVAGPRTANCRGKGSTHRHEHASLRQILQRSSADASGCNRNTPLTQYSRCAETRHVKQAGKALISMRTLPALNAKHVDEHGKDRQKLEGHPRTDGKLLQCSPMPCRPGPQGRDRAVASRQQKFVLQTALEKQVVANHVGGCSLLKGKRSRSKRSGVVHAREQCPEQTHMTNDCSQGVRPDLEVQGMKRCARKDGRQWQCSQHAKPGFRFCEHHHAYMNKKKTQKT